MLKKGFKKYIPIFLFSPEYQKSPLSSPGGGYTPDPQVPNIVHHAWNIQDKPVLHAWFINYVICYITDLNRKGFRVFWTLSPFKKRSNLWNHFGLCCLLEIQSCSFLCKIFMRLHFTLYSRFFSAFPNTR